MSTHIVSTAAESQPDPDSTVPLSEPWARIGDAVHSQSNRRNESLAEGASGRRRRGVTGMERSVHGQAIGDEIGRTAM